MLGRRTFLTGAAAAASVASTSLTPAARASAKTCAPPSLPAQKPGEVLDGGARLILIPGGYKVWTKRVGHSPVKVLLLHGGPGFCHDYFECFEDFLPQAGIEFYYYDQLGCGYSDHPNDDSLWTVARYVEEVEAVRKGLGLENFILYGHSWGGMLAMEYALKYQQNLSRLVISDMTASVAAYVQYAAVLRRQLSAADQATLAKYEALNQTDAPAYRAVMDKVYAEHFLRLTPWPEPVSRTFAKMNTHIYNVMQGPNEFVITGNFRHWDRWADLPKIKTRTLVMGAKYDEMSPDQIRREGRLIPNASTWIGEQGSHMCMYDDQRAYFMRLLPFLLNGC
ncbi:MAG: proline iminopeptidase-family hydrolase [Alphaproteobacteria bacterium]|nr:proline iminopeptidase-family hydrolase [Alphaproteobacteria bacterium]MBU6472806.1 proline iminopeptidase-family hydrolase [Alphaproteobacteria bacterium]MDE2074173.1 proline iminopeptidase-family hydrolase [Alphaproteobacteria bacterium]